MSRKDFTVTNSNFPGSSANPNSIDKIRELSEVAMATESPSVDSDNDISKLIKNLLFMGRLSKDVKIGEATFTVNTLTEDRQRVLVSRVMRMTNEEKIAYAKVYSVAESVTAINGISIDEISKTMYPDEESLEVARINFFGRLQSTIIDILFEEYEVLIKKSREEIGYEEVKK
jgi:hypothetical protein